MRILITLTILLLAVSAHADGICLPTDEAPHMEEICRVQTRPMCAILESQGNCFWYEPHGEGVCALAEGAPSHMEALCHAQEQLGCQLLEEQGNCFWQEDEE